MSTKTPASRRPAPPIVSAVVQPVAKHLARMEALLLEMRHEQDVQLKRVGVLQGNIETLLDELSTAREIARRRPRGN